MNIERIPKGKICPQPEPDPDAYLEPINAEFGSHQGLNANWSCMAWRISGTLDEGVFLLDDETPDETVSIVTRVEGDDGTTIAQVAHGSVEKILPIAKAIKGEK